MNPPVNRGRLFAVVTAVVLSVVTGLLIAQSSNASDGADASGSGAVSDSAANAEQSPTTPTPTTSVDAAAPSVDADGWIVPKGTNIPMTPMKLGDTAPQFVIFSFDGAGRHDKMTEFLQAAAPTDSRFVGFLTGTYLLADDHAGAYQGPGAEPGTSAVGFGGDLAEVEQRVNDLNTFYSLGNEIGTHYNGHFCDLGANWSTAEWNSELDQFFSWFSDWQSVNGVTDGPKLQVPPGEVQGGRTPCLTGQMDQLTPAWSQHGMSYDSSGENPFTGIAWPEQRDGIWQFPIPTVYSPAFVQAGFSPLIKAMDYNFWFKFNEATEDPASQPQLTQIVLDTYRYMYQQTYNGNRAPILVANHFNDWNGNSFNPAALQFMQEVCGQPETICTTYQDVIAWMKLQDPKMLAKLQKLMPVADRDPNEQTTG